MMKKIALFLFFVLILFCSQAQKVYFKYDKAGNRTQKTTTLEVINTKRFSKSVTDSNDYLNERKVYVYPSPTQGDLFIVVSDNGKPLTGAATICDASGKEVVTRLVSSLRTRLDITDQPKGVYILVLSLDHKIVSWKIIKQ